jgi:hypothetical protein
LGKLNRIKSIIIIIIIKNMKKINHLEKFKLGAGNCFTFEEAAEFLKPVLGTKDLNGFLKSAGYFEHQVPKNCYLRNNLFRAVPIWSSDEEKLCHSVAFYITIKGMAEIFKQASKNYIKVQILTDDPFSCGY